MQEYTRLDGARQPIGVPDYDDLTARRTALLRQRRIGRGVLLELLLVLAYVAAARWQ